MISSTSHDRPPRGIGRGFCDRDRVYSRQRRIDKSANSDRRDSGIAQLQIGCAAQADLLKPRAAQSGAGNIAIDSTCQAEIVDVANGQVRASCQVASRRD